MSLCIKLEGDRWLLRPEHLFMEGAFCIACGTWKGSDMPKIHRDMAMPEKPAMSQATKDLLRDRNLEKAALRRELHPSRVKGPHRWQECKETIVDHDDKCNVEQTQAQSGVADTPKKKQTALDKILEKD